MQTSEQLERFSLELRERAERYLGDLPPPPVDANEVYAWLSNCLKQLADLTAAVEALRLFSPHANAAFEEYRQTVAANRKREEAAGRRPAQADQGPPSAAIPSNTAQSPPKPLPVQHVDDSEMDPKAQVVPEAAVAARVAPEGFRAQTPQEIAAAAANATLPPGCPQCGMRGGHYTNCPAIAGLIPPLG